MLPAIGCPWVEVSPQPGACHGLCASTQAAAPGCCAVPWFQRRPETVWVSCSLRAGEAVGRYVPQAVMNKEGKPLDIHIVLNEIFSDNDEVMVEYSNGPVAYKVRCGDGFGSASR